MVSSNSLRSSSKKPDRKKPTKETRKGDLVSENNKEHGSRKRKVVQEKPNRPTSKSAKTSTGKSLATSQKMKEKANLRPEKTEQGKNMQKLGSTSKNNQLNRPNPSLAASKKLKKANLRPEKIEQGKNKQKLGSTSKNKPLLNRPNREKTSVERVKEPSARKIKIMQALGLAAPTGSPFQQNRIGSLKVK